jgi:MFS family permease
MDKLGSVTRSMKKRVQWLVKPGSVEDRNVRNVLIDGLGVGIVSGASTFLAVFLARLGASPFLVGMLTSMPALTGMFLAMPVGSMLERQKNVVPWYSRARVWTFFSLALTGIVTMVLPIAWAPWAIILIWAVATFPQTVVNVAFTMVMSAVAGPNRRFYLMSRRWSTIGITSAISVACVGWLLEHFAFPANYQYVFIGSFIGGMISFAFSSQITIPDNEPIEPPTGSKLNWFANMRESLHTVREQVPYTKMLISQFVFRCGLTMVMPLLPLYWVNQLQLSDRWIGSINMIQSTVLLVAYFAWSEASRRKGLRFVLLACAFGLVSYPILTGITTNPALLLVYAGFSGIFTAGMDLVLFDLLLRTCPPKHNASYIALYQTSNHVATFAAPLLGTFLAGILGYGPALILGGGLRLLGAILFIVMGVGSVTAIYTAKNQEQTIA